MAWVLLSALQLPAAPSWASLFPSLTLEFSLLVRKEACLVSRALDVMPVSLSVIPVAAMLGRSPCTHFTDEDSKAQGIKYLATERVRGRAGTEIQALGCSSRCFFITFCCFVVSEPGAGQVCVTC